MRHLKPLFLSIVFTIFLSALTAHATPFTSTISADAPSTGYLTTDNTPQNVALFEVTDHSSVIGRLLIIARRVSDGASKAWDITSLSRRDGSTVTNLGNVGGAAPFGATADLTALALVSIAFFTDPVTFETGLTITGINGSTIEWTLTYRGIQMID